MKKKGNVGQIPSLILAFVIAGIMAVTGVQLIEDTKDSLPTGNVNASCATYGFGCNYSTEWLGANNASDGLQTISEKFPLLGTVTILGVIIATIVGVGFVRANL